MSPRDKAFQYFKDIGDIPDDGDKWVLHHINPMLRHFDRQRYDEWRIEDLLPMTNEQHMKLHARLRYTGEFDRMFAETYESECQ